MTYPRWLCIEMRVLYRTLLVLGRLIDCESVLLHCQIAGRDFDCNLNDARILLAWMMR